MEENNIKVDYISGASSGSIIATLYALGYSYDKIFELFKKYSKKIKYFNYKNIIKLIFGILIKRKIIINGLNSGKIIEELINEYCLKKEIKNIKDIKMPLIIPSVDLHTGKIYFFSSKINRNKISDDIIYCNDINIGKAVRASCSYPVIFSPCKFKNTELIDGGIRENIPWKETKKMGADKVISVVFEKEYDGKCCKNLIDVVKGSMSILNHELSNYELNGVDYLLKIKTKNIGLLDMKNFEELFYLGYSTTIKNIKEIKKVINI